MKYLTLLAAICVIYMLFMRNSPVASVERAVAEAEAITGPAVAAPVAPAPAGATPPPRTNALKRPIDRTREVLGQVEKRNGAGEF